MPTGYKFKGEGSTKSVRQHINLNNVWDHRGKTKEGNPIERKNVVINVAQDDHTPENAQTDSRLRYDVYDRELFDETKGSNNQQGVDSTISVTNNQWNDLLEAGDISEQKYMSTGADGKPVEKTGKFLSYESDLAWTKYRDPADPEKIVKGVVPKTKTAQAMETPFDKSKHDDVVAGARASAAKSKASKAEKVKQSAEKEDLDADLEP